MKKSVSAIQPYRVITNPLAGVITVSGTTTRAAHHGKLRLTPADFLVTVTGGHSHLMNQFLVLMRIMIVVDKSLIAGWRWEGSDSF